MDPCDVIPELELAEAVWLALEVELEVELDELEVFISLLTCALCHISITLEFESFPVDEEFCLLSESLAALCWACCITWFCSSNFT